MEQKIKIKTPDGHLIYGCLNFQKRREDRLIVFVHGLTGNMHEHMHFNGSAYFTALGLSTLRFNLYGDEPRARRFADTTITTHARDLEVVLQWAQSMNFKIAVAGHSLGAPTILYSDSTAVKAVVFWDPAGSPRQRIKVWGKYDRKHNGYFIDWGTKVLLGNKMYKEALELPDTYKAVRDLKAPLLIVAAEKGNLKTARRYYQNAHSPKKLIVVKGATHCFDEEGAEKALFKATENWLGKYLEA